MRSILSFVKKFLMGYRLLLFFLISISLIASFFSLLSVYISGKFIDFLSMAALYDNAGLILGFYCTIFAISNVLSLLISFSGSRVYTKIHTNLVHSICISCVSHIQQESYIYINQINAAKTTQQIQGDSNEIVSYFLGLFQNIPSHLLKLIASIVMIYFSEKWLLSIILLLIIAYILFYSYFKNLLYLYSKKFKIKQTKYFSKLAEQLNFAPYVKLHGLEKNFITRVIDSFQELYSTALKSQIVQFAFSGVSSSIITCGQILLFLFGGEAVLEGRLTIGNFTVINIYFTYVLSSVKYFYSLGSLTQSATVSFDRISEIYAMEIPEKGVNTVDSFNSISLANVTFRMNNKCVFKNLSVNFEKGNIYSVFGRNGSGKSSLLYLISGLYTNYYSGHILINGIDIKTLDMDKIRFSNFGFVEQEPALLSDSLLNNLNLFQNNSDRNFSSADKLIDLFDLRNRLSKNGEFYNVTFNEHSSDISGGEKQKIAIIREILKKPEVLLLDEPTSAMDVKGVNELFDVLNYLKKTCIIIITSHDNRLISKCDKIIHL